MGCCLSSGKLKSPPVSTSSAAAVQIPPPIEEESVKEVVVQTVSVSVPPIPPPVSVSVPKEPKISDSETNNNLPLPPPPPSSSLSTPEISHTKSDICSVSHSFSTATTTATAASILEDDALSKPRRPPPPSHHPPSSRCSRVSRSPGERHSPQRNLRPRLAAKDRPNPSQNRRNVNSGPLHKSDLDGPRRRSPSPATRGPSSARRSPMKKREGVGASEKKDEETKVDVEVNKEAVDDVKKEDLSVKDPEVSMECFIFL